MGARKPPNWAPATDRIAKLSGVTTITYTRPIGAGTLCHYCDKAATTRDHVVPDSARGVSHWWNLVPACEPCNSSKEDR